MNESRYPFSDAAIPRYERLSRLVRQYELGEITHEAFQRVKRDILLGQAAPETASLTPTELLIATYAFDAQYELNQSLEALRGLVAGWSDVIDAASASRSSVGDNHIRAIPGITRSRRPSVIIAICGLLFPLDSVQYTPDDPTWNWRPVLEYLLTEGIGDQVLHNLGNMLPPGSTSVIVVYRSKVADMAAGAFHGFDSFARRILSSEIVKSLDEQQELQRSSGEPPDIAR